MVEEGDIGTVLNYVLLHAKYYINANRLKENYRLSIATFKAILKYNLKIEQEIAQTKHPLSFQKFSLLFEIL